MSNSRGAGTGAFTGHGGAGKIRPRRRELFARATAQVDARSSFFHRASTFIFRELCCQNNVVEYATRGTPRLSPVCKQPGINLVIRGNRRTALRLGPWLQEVCDPVFVALANVPVWGLGCVITGAGRG